MGLKITTDGKPVTVVRKDGTSQNGKAYTMYSLMYPFKNANDEYENVFVNAQFRKGTDLANKTKINITNAFMTGSEFNGNTKAKIFVLDFEVAEQGEAQVQQNFGDFVNIPDGIEEDGLPFN